MGLHDAQIKSLQGEKEALELELNKYKQVSTHNQPQVYCEENMLEHSVQYELGSPVGTARGF